MSSKKGILTLFRAKKPLRKDTSHTLGCWWAF